MNTWAIVLAAGSGTRLSEATGGEKKQFLPFKGAPLFWNSVRTFSRVARVKGIVLVFPPDALDAARTVVDGLMEAEDPGLPIILASGGKERQDSVYNGLGVLPSGCGTVLVHDAARPFATAALFNALIDAITEETPAAIPAVPVKDTIKRVSGSTVAETMPRAELAAVQTPQAFHLDTLRRAHEFCRERSLAVTDDASMAEAMGVPVTVIPGEEDNIKITTPEDLRMLDTTSPAPIPVTGWGYDVHKYGTGRPMVLGGVPIPGAPEVVAHSDGDVLLHALADALLGCLGKGDIGEHFPDSDAKFDGIESSILVNEVLELAHDESLTIVHADLTIICQTPKISPHKTQIHSAITNLLRLAPTQVNVKATTEEGLGFTGEKKGIKAVACVTALRKA